MWMVARDEAPCGLALCFADELAYNQRDTAAQQVDRKFFIVWGQVGLHQGRLRVVRHDEAA